MGKKKDLLAALPIVAQALGAKYGVKVKIGGDKACTDGQTIFLPALPPDDEEVGVLVRGYLDHEAAHVRLTEGELTGTKLERGLQNVLEDVRIEKKMGELYPGCKMNLENLAAKLTKDGKFRPITEQDHPAAVLQGYLLYRLRQSVLGQAALDSLADLAENAMRKTFPKAVAARIEALAFQVEECESTDDVKALAARIKKAIQEEEEKEQERQQQEEGSESSSGGNEQGGGAGQGSPGQDPNQDQGQGGQGDGEDDQKGQSGKKPSPMRQALDATEEDLLNDTFDDVAKALEEKCQASGNGVDVSDDLKATTPQEAAGAGMGTAPILYGDRPDKAEAQRATNALRARLDGLIQATRLERNRTSRTGRRIDSRVLHRVAVSDMRVFRQRIEKQAVNTAIYILVDRSGSMNDQMKLANLAVYSVAMALEGIKGVSFKTAVFPVEHVDVATLTPFGGKVRESDYAVTAAGGTPIVQAMWRAASDLMARPEPRRILLVVSDGQVAHQAAELISLLSRMRASGVETLGLGIGFGSDIGKFFPISSKIRHSSELASAMFSMLQHQLVPKVA